MENTSFSSQGPNDTKQSVFVNIPLIYSNGFQVALSAADMAVTLTANGQPIQILNISYSTAKALAEALRSALEKYEQDTNTKILSSREAASILRKKS